MKGLIRWFLVPAVLLVGMAFVSEQPAQAGWWRVRVGPCAPYYGYYVDPYYHPYTTYYYAPRPVRVYRAPVVVTPPVYGPYVPYPVVPYSIW